MVHFANDAEAVPLQVAALDGSQGNEGRTDSEFSQQSGETAGAPPHVVDSVALEQLGDSIAELAAHLHAATYRLLVMLAELNGGFLRAPTGAAAGAAPSAAVRTG